MTILMGGNIIIKTCTEFVPVPKRKQKIYLFDCSNLFSKITKDVCHIANAGKFDYCLRTTSTYHSDTVAVLCPSQRNLYRRRKEKT